MVSSLFSWSAPPRPLVRALDCAEGVAATAAALASKPVRLRVELLAPSEQIDRSFYWGRLIVKVTGSEYP